MGANSRLGGYSNKYGKSKDKKNAFNNINIVKLNNKIKLKMEGLNIGRSCFFWFFFFS